MNTFAHNLGTASQKQLSKIEINGALLTSMRRGRYSRSKSGGRCASQKADLKINTHKQERRLSQPMINIKPPGTPTKQK
jgi:hypothetical protein